MVGNQSAVRSLLTEARKTADPQQSLYNGMMEQNRDDRDMTPIFMAIQGGNGDVAKFLIEMYNIDARTIALALDDGASALPLPLSLAFMKDSSRNKSSRPSCMQLVGELVRPGFLTRNSIRCLHWVRLVVSLFHTDGVIVAEELAAASLRLVFSEQPTANKGWLW